MSDPSLRAWRPVIAALANDDARRVFARLTLGLEGDPFAGLSPSRRSHVRQQLTSAGIIDVNDGEVALRPDVFTSILRHVAVSRPTGIQRFLHEGRIVQYPARPAERLELLEWIAEQVLKPSEVVSEREVSERLASYTNDTAALRRYLVDAGIVARTATGSEYVLPE